MPLIKLEGYEEFGELAAGLQWFSGLDHETKAQAKQNVKLNHGRYATYREVQWEDDATAGGVAEGVHHGIYLDDGASPVGKVAAADLLAISHPNEEFYAVVQLQNDDEFAMYWYVGIDDGRVVAGTDIVGDWDTVFNHVQSVYGGAAFLSDTAALYLPESKLGSNVGVDAISINELELFSDGSVNSTHPIQRTSSRAPLFIVLFLAFCAGGYYVLDKYTEEVVPAVIYTPKISFEEIKSNFIQEEKASLKRAGPLHDPVQASQIPLELIRKNNLNLYGWGLQKLTLDLSAPVKEGNSESTLNIVAHYIRDKGDVSTAKNKADRFSAGFKISTNGDDVYIRYPLESASVDWLSMDLIAQNTPEDGAITDALANLQLLSVKFEPEDQKPMPRTTNIEAPDLQFQMGGNYYIPVDMKEIAISGQDSTMLISAMENISKMGLVELNSLTFLPINNFQYSWSATLTSYLLRPGAEEESSNDAN